MGFLVMTANPPFMRDYNEERQALEGIGASFEIVQVHDEDEFARVAAPADGLLTGKARISRKVIEHLEHCKVISASGIGLDAIDVDAATERGIVVVNIPDIFTEEVADQAFALLLAVNRQVVFCHEMLKAGRWGEVRPLLSIPKIPGKTLGLVAFGNIARAVARRAKGFNVEILAHDPYVSAEVMREHGVEKVELDDLFRRSDFISSHLPHTRDTTHYLGAPQFALMKPSAIFVNTGRGRVVDEAALAAALRAGQLAGAGLDVFEQEPLSMDSPLLQLPNVVLTPHMASASNESDIARRYRAGEEIAAVLSGRLPRNCVNKEVLARLNLRP